jgi:predicted  nucleic acid-binding Zn-ribbon protein
LNRHLKELIELSKLDKTIDSFTPQIESANKKLNKAQKKIDKAQAEYDELETSIKENETKIASFEEQISMLNEQLNANAKKFKEISSEKELKALSLEEDIAKEKLTFANEEIERLQEINETKKELLEEQNSQIENTKTEFETINKEVSSTLEDIETKKGELFNKRVSKSRNLEQKVLSFYEKIRIWAGNSAVVPVKKQACYGCYIKLNDKTYSEIIKADEIVNCPHCGRILYIEDEA